VGSLQPPWVDQSTIPELREIRRLGLLARVRIFEARCQNGDRLLDVIRVNGRPLALGWQAIGAAVVVDALEGGPRQYHRVPLLAIWLDVDRMLDPPIRLWFPTQCQHESVQVPADWLRGQVEAGLRKRVVVIDDAARREMGTRARGG
jgi:hypothetical protein